MLIFRTYGKAVVAVLYAAYLAISPIVISGGWHFTTQQVASILVGCLTATSVWLVPLFPNYPWVKTFVAQGVIYAQIFVAGSVTGGPVDWNIVIASVAAYLGIYAAPAASATGAAVGWGSDREIRP